MKSANKSIPYAKTMMLLEINQIRVSFGVSVFLIFFSIRIFWGKCMLYVPLNFLKSSLLRHSTGVRPMRSEEVMVSAASASFLSFISFSMSTLGK